MKRIFVFIYFCSVFFLWGETLDIAIWSPEGHNSLDRTQIFFNELERRTGINFNLIHLPLNRAVINLDEGLIDGNFNRTKQAYENSDNVLFSRQPISYFPFNIVSRDSSIDPAEPESFREKRLVIVQGTKIINDWINETGITNVTTVKDFVTVLNMLKLDRGDYTIGNQQVYPFLAYPEFNNLRILNPPVLQITVHLVIHKRYKSLMETIDTALEEMAAEGWMERLLQK